jgi:hypothetical protein
VKSPRKALLGLLLLCGCAAPDRPQIEHGATHVGVPRPQIDAAIVDEAQAPEASAAAAAIRPPDRMTLPATYRLMLVDGCMTLERETDGPSSEPEATPVGEVSGAAGVRAYLPSPLPEEIAAEIAADHEAVLRMDRALEAVMLRSHELARQAVSLEAQSKKMAELLVRAQSRVRDPEAPPHSAAPGTASANAGAQPP